MSCSGIINIIPHLTELIKMDTVEMELSCYRSPSSTDARGRLDHCCLERKALVWDAGDLRTGEVF